MRLRMKTIPISFKIVLLIAAMGAAAACGSEDSVRSYIEEPRQTAGTSDARAARTGTPPAAYGWDTPEGWDESRTGSGFRLASFAVKTPMGDLLCTVTPLKGAGGGIEANVRRWRDQLGLSDLAGERFDRFLTGQESFEIAGGIKGLYIDFSPHVAEEDAASILAAIIRLEDTTVFFKLTGPRIAIESQREKFKALCESFRKK